ncbi:MAG: hypothetical protein CME06_13285 [Gemmatimonadetes bacterium]|nr:hypothetical protein [Gemmatimonadota bacterium]
MQQATRRDATSDPKEERRLGRVRETHLEQLFDTMHEGFVLAEVIVDDAGNPSDRRYLDVNPTFERLVGKSRDEVINRTVREDFPEVDATFDILASPQPSGRFTLLFVDVSARVEAERERLEAERRVQPAQRVESLGVLAGGIVHDFNNLLVGVLGFAGFL